MVGLPQRRTGRHVFHVQCNSGVAAQTFNIRTESLRLWILGAIFEKVNDTHVSFVTGMQEFANPCWALVSRAATSVMAEMPWQK
jgi:hypothetical protein